MNPSFPEFENTPIDRWSRQIEKELQRLSKTTDQLPYPISKFISTEEYPPLSETAEKWQIRENYSGGNASKVNKQLLKGLEHGVEAIGLHVDDATNLNEVLNKVLVDAVDLNWSTSSTYSTLLDQLSLFKSDSKLPDTAFKGGIEQDPLGNLALYGKWKRDHEADFNDLCSSITGFELAFPHYRLLNISAQHYHNAGANVVQELGAMLSHLSEYLSSFGDRQFPLAPLAHKIQLSTATGTNYFLEMAKIRAMRLLFNQLMEAYGCSESSCFIRVESSFWHFTNMDRHLNILRTTTAAMAAILGGCNSLRVLPFDTTGVNSSSRSRRIALNIQHLLLEESHFSKTKDPAAGSHFIEHLTNDIAAQAWTYFQELENTGGFLANLKNGSLQSSIGKQATKTMEEIAEKKKMVMGVNQHISPDQQTVFPMAPSPKNGGVPQEVLPLNPLRASSLSESSFFGQS
jgi:methylmalonyl-CoA mutase